MNLSLFFARRYLFSRKSHSAINIISGVSALGIAVSTMALVCVLSVFNGFRELIAGLYSAFDPEIELVPLQANMPMPTTPLSCGQRGWTAWRTLQRALKKTP